MPPLTVTIAGPRNSANVSGIYTRMGPLLEATEPRAVVIDLSGLDFIAPCAIAALSVTLQEAVRRGVVRSPGQIIAPTNPAVESYLHVMDFYALLGMEAAGTRLRRRPVGFMPAAMIPANPAADSSGRVARLLVDALQHRCELQNRAGDTLWSNLSEILDNVQLHAESGIGAVAVAASWPSNRRIEIAVGDAGIGIPRAIRRNPYLSVDADSDAMRAAIQRLVSGTTDPGRGRGLWQVSEIVRRNGGTLVLIAESTRLTVTEDGVRVQPSQPVLGTLAIMRFNMDIPVGLADILEPDAAEPLDDFVEFDPWNG